MKKIVAVMIIILLVAPSMVFAVEEGKAKEGPIIGGLTTIREAGKGVVDTAMSPLVALKDNEPGKVVSDPVEKGGKTLYETGKNTAETIALQN